MKAAFDRDALRGFWALIEMPLEKEFTTLLLSSYFDSEVRVGVDRRGAHHLILPSDARRRPWTVADSPLRDSIRDLEFAGMPGRYLDIACDERSLDDLFDELILDVLPPAMMSISPASAVDDALTRWRNLFRASRLSALSRQKRFGVFGELFVLRTSLELFGADAIEFWRGPEGETHDFEFPSGCLEVKTAGEASEAITVHGPSQLETHDNRPLYLAVLTVRESTAGVTVDEVTQQVAQIVGEARLKAKMEKLGLADWRGESDPLGVAETMTLEVTDGLSRITTASIANFDPTSLVRLEYDLSLRTLRLSRSVKSIESLIADFMVSR